MIGYDVEVTWVDPALPEVKREVLPATCCYTQDVFGMPWEDNATSRAQVFNDAVEANIIDFPDDIEGLVPISIVIKTVSG